MEIGIAGVVLRSPPAQHGGLNKLSPNHPTPLTFHKVAGERNDVGAAMIFAEKFQRLICWGLSIAEVRHAVFTSCHRHNIHRVRPQVEPGTNHAVEAGWQRYPHGGGAGRYLFAR